MIFLYFAHDIFSPLARSEQIKADVNKTGHKTKGAYAAYSGVLWVGAYARTICLYPVPVNTVLADLSVECG